MDEVVIDDLEIRAAIECLKELITHTHQRGGAAWSKIEAAQQFLPARLSRAMDLGGRLV
jgi:hypothetical protein